MTLTQKNYYTKENNYISNSKIGDFLKDKAYFKAKHIDCTIVEPCTQAMRFGLMVDTLLTEGITVFNKKFQIKVLKKDNPGLFAEQAMSDNIEIVAPQLIEKTSALVNAIYLQDAYKDIKDYDTQIILQQDFKQPINGFSGLCGMLDFLKIEGTTAHIVDLKTSSSVDPFKYKYKAEDFGYFRQMAMYSSLVASNFPHVTDITCSHLVAESLAPYRMNTFIFDPSRMESELIKLYDVITQVTSEKKWAHNNISWKDAEVLN